MMVDKASDYQYTATFENKKGQDQECAVWLKYGPDGAIDGFFKGKEAFKFTLPAGGKKVLAAEANSQGGAACGVGGVPTTQWGQFAGTWLEFDFANLSNKGYSGADASSLAAADANMAVAAMSVCADGQPCSIIHDGGSGENAYTKGTNAEDGIGLNIPPGPVALKVTVG